MNERERTLLLVDDESNIVAALTRLLRRDGYRILRANSGQEGLSILEQETVGVIVSDQRMPEMTGIEFLMRVRERYPETVRIILSGYTDLNSVTEAINQGAVYKFLTKPWEDELLRTNISEAFDYYEMKQENLRLTAELQQRNAELASFNQELEQRVEAKTREALQNLHALKISQAVLAQLPIAVVGLDDDGLIVVSNQQADTLLSAKPGLIGRFAEQALPPSLHRIYQQFKQNGVEQGRYIDDQEVEYQVCLSRLAGSGSGSGAARGTILIMHPRPSW